ncbi:hypothetical protein U9M48_004378, partial [Paspalum notatum var. saurae]
LWIEVGDSLTPITVRPVTPSLSTRHTPHAHPAAAAPFPGPVRFAAGRLPIPAASRLRGLDPARRPPPRPRRAAAPPRPDLRAPRHRRLPSPSLLLGGARLLLLLLRWLFSLCTWRLGLTPPRWPHRTGPPPRPHSFGSSLSVCLCRSALVPARRTLRPSILSAELPSRIAEGQKKEETASAAGKAPVKKQSAGELCLHKGFELYAPHKLRGGTFVFTFQVSPSYPHDPRRSNARPRCTIQILIWKVIADYSPNDDLLEQEFMLQGRWFHRKDLEDLYAMFNRMASIATELFL